MKDNDLFRPAAAIFDMDGLLLDTEEPAVPLWVQAGKSSGWRVSPETVIRTLGIDGPGTRAIFMQELGPEFPFDEIRKEFRRLYEEKFKKVIDLKSGVITLLDHLSSHKIPAAVATSTHHNNALIKLGVAGIQDRFAVVVGGDEISRGKPAPDIFLMAVDKLGKKPSECIGFEDSPAGLEAIHAAGMRSVFVKDLAQPSGEILSTVWRQYTNLGEAIELFR